MEIKRRDFIKLVGGISSSLALAGCGLDEVFEIPDRLVDRVRSGPGMESWKNTICGLCPGGCGMSVRLIDGLPVGMKGNSSYPVNQGGLCPLGLNALQHLYHPDRLKGPVQRIGKAGSSRWEAISWDDALKMISDRMIALRGENRAREVAILGQNERGVMAGHLKRFMEAYGSPNYYRFPASQNETVPLRLMHGRTDMPSYDLLNAKLVLSFGGNFLQEGYSPVHYTKLYSGHRERQTEYIQVDSRMSLTAANADRWIPVRPGTYGAFALGIAYVLIREELCNLPFVQRRTFGFDDWFDGGGVKHLGFKNIVLGNYYPEKVSEITGVPAGTILEIGRQVGNTPKTVVLGSGGTVNNTNGTFSQMAVQCLNALLGNYDQEGGIFFPDPTPLEKFPDIELDGPASEGNRSLPVAGPLDVSYPLSEFSIDSFTRNVLAGKPYPLSVLFLYGGNPLFHALNHLEFTEALKRIPLVVSFDSIISETSEYAHLILPDHTFLEGWGEVSDVPTIGFSHFGVQQPVIEPLYDTRSTGDVFIQLAEKIGGTVSSAAPLGNYREVVKHAAHGMYHSGKGAVVTKGQRQRWLEYLQQRGWQVGRYSSFDEFWDQLLEHGGWWNPVRSKGKGLFRTPSGKFEFYSQILFSELQSLVSRNDGSGTGGGLEAVLSRLSISTRGDHVMHPHHEPVAYEGDRPLYMVTFQVFPNRDGSAAALPMMQEMFGYSVHAPWQSWLEIHPETAEVAGISDNDWVWIESSVGSLRVKAKITPGIMPEVVAVPFGMGHTSFGRYAKGFGVNPNSIMRNMHDRISGRPAIEATKVKITRAT